MHDNIEASKAVKDSKSMVFLIPTVNRRNDGNLRSDCLYQHKENFKTLLAVFINTVLLLLGVKLSAKNDRNLSLFVDNMQLIYIQRLKSCLKFFKFLSYGTK